jgi:tetratricopeptide (TPR) repeat protein
MNIKTIIGSILIIIGVGLILFVGFMIFALFSVFPRPDIGDLDIRDIFSDRLLIFVTPPALVSLICIASGFYLVKSGRTREKENSSNVKSWIQSGITFKNQGMYKEALKSFNLALNTKVLRFMQRIKLLLEKAEICRLMGNVEEAIQCCKKVLKLNSSDQEAKQLLEELVA